MRRSSWRRRCSTTVPHQLRVIAIDRAGQRTERDLALRMDQAPPEITISGSLADAAEEPLTAAQYELHTDAADAGTGLGSIELLIDGQRRDYVEQSCPGDGCSLADDFTLTSAELTPGEHKIRLVARDAAGHAAERSWSAYVPAAGTPQAPPVDPTEIASLHEQTAFLYTGADPIQPGVAAGTIEPERAAVIRGLVLNRADEPIAGATVSVADHPEYGHTTTGENGEYYLAVNGGGMLTARVEHSGHMTVDREVEVPWQQYAWASEVVLTPRDDQVTTVDLGSPLSPPQLATSSQVSDERGNRRVQLFFPQGVQAEMEMPDGSTQPLDELHVRLTEVTTGPGGPSAMPAEMPQSTAYTWAADFSVDEAVAAGASTVRFNRPVYGYVENFLAIKVGATVPSGYYDPAATVWKGENDGRVLKILSTTGGRATVDLSGSGQPATQAQLDGEGFTEAELAKLAELYPAGQQLWRIPVAHFSWVDWNYSWGFPIDAIGPAFNFIKDVITDPCHESGSVIDCENRTLGEDIPVAGTDQSLHYRSDRAAGRRADSTAIDIPLTGATVPASMRCVDVQVRIAGRAFRKVYNAAPNLRWTFEWDGRDAFGRTLQGGQPAKIRVNYRYPISYAGNSASFGSTVSWNESGRRGWKATPGLWDENDCQRGGIGENHPGVFFNVGAYDVLNWVDYERMIGGFDARRAGLAGWSISDHHTYDPVAKVLYRGDGSKTRALSKNRVIESLAGGGSSNADGVPARQARVDSPDDLAIAPDGSVLYTDWYGHRVRRVDPDGVVRTVAGTGADGSTGDGGPATQATLKSPGAIDVARDGSVYIADFNAGNIRKVSPAGIISTVAAAYRPRSVAAAADGSVYFGQDVGGILRLTPEGRVVPFTGTGSTIDTGTLRQQFYCGSGGYSMADAPDGSLVILCGTYLGHRYISRIDPSGVAELILPTSSPGTSSGDGGPAIAAKAYARGIDVGPDGTIYLSDGVSNRVRRITPAGIITSIAGGGPSSTNRGDGGPATGGYLNTPIGVAAAPDGSLLIAEWSGDRIRRVTPALPGYTGEDYAIASTDGGELYRFDANGRHLSSADTLTGTTTRTFGYDGAGRLATIGDADDNVTSIERDTSGAPARIVGPYGQATRVTTDGNGYLASLTDALGSRTSMTYESGGLLSQLTDPNGNASSFVYDDLGRLNSDHNAAGGTKTLAQTDTTTSSEVTVTTAEGRSRRYKSEITPTETMRRTVTDAAGVATVRETDPNGDRRAVSADGTTSTSKDAPDPRFGMDAPLPAATSMTTPGGRSASSTVSRQVTLANADDPLSLLSLVETQTTNGNAWSSTYNRAASTITARSPEARTATTVLDGKGRAVKVTVPGVVPVDLTYDPRGRIDTATQGTRAWRFAYHPDGRLASVTDPKQRVESYGYDAAGRETRRTLPGSGEIRFGYDPAGAATSLTPPGRPPHTFGHTPIGLLERYTPPDAGDGAGPARITYDRDGQVDTLTRPDGSLFDLNYDTAGRLSTLDHADGAVTYGYNAASGQLSNAETSAGERLDLGYDGPLPTSSIWTGPVAGTVTRTYSNDLRTSSSSVNGSQTASYSYDRDGLVTGVGALSLTRNATTGFASSTSLGTITTAHTYDAYGDTDTYTVQASAGQLFRTDHDRDALGRITATTETLAGQTTTYGYGYDAAGRLTQVTRGGMPVETYEYDSNGDRSSTTRNGQTTTAGYDAQDRLTQSGTRTYTYTRNGELKTITDEAADETTTLRYDALGSLLKVTLPDGDDITYLTDAAGRRVGKQRNGTLERGYLYDASPAPVAELDADGTVRSRFVYAPGAHAPSYMLRGGDTYRFVTDDRGSPRLVVNTATGQIAQRLDYDAYGVITQDTNPDFQPFGYAGGLYDPDTKLTRFGARDYDPDSGRWTAKDPIAFAGGDTNLYAYVANDPVNSIDPSGLIVDTVADVGFVAYDLNQLIRGCGSLAALGADIGATFVPFVTGAGVATRAGLHMDDAVELGARHVDGAGDMITTGKRTNWQFINHHVDDQGRTVTSISRFDVNPADAHVQKHGPHLNLETHIDGVQVSNQHRPIDGGTIRPGDVP